MRFFNEDIHKSWLKWTKVATDSIRDSIPVITDFPPADLAAEDASDGSPRAKRRRTSHGIAALDVDYAKEMEYVKKAKDVVESEREGACSVCNKHLEHDAGIYTICPNPRCETVTHITCLSKHFLKNDDGALVPINGTCPSCKTELRWVDIAKELNLRMRGQKEVEKLLKAKRTRGGRATASQTVIEASDMEEEDIDDDLESDYIVELKRLKELNPTGSKMEMGDRWHTIDDADDSDMSSVFSISSQSKKAETSAPSGDGALATVIEDSD